MIDFKGTQFERDILLWGVRWYVAYPISYRQLEEMMQERGVEVDHSSLNRWVLKYAQLLDQVFRQRKRPWARAGAWTRPTCATRSPYGSCSHFNGGNHQCHLVNLV